MAKKVILHDAIKHHVSSRTAQSVSETLFNTIKTSINNAYTDIDENSAGSNVVVEITIVIND